MKEEKSVKSRTVLRSKLTILMLFSFLFISLLWRDNNTIFAQDYSRVQTTPTFKGRPQKDIIIPNSPLASELGLAQVPTGVFPFLTNLSVTPGDTFVDLVWTPLWKEETRKPSKVREFRKLIEERLEKDFMLREKSLSAPKTEEVKQKEKERLEKETLEAIRGVKEIAGYIIHYGTESRNYIQKVDVGSVTMYRVRGLSNYTTYFFALQAYTSLGETSEISEEVSATPKPEEELMSVIERGFAEEEIPQVISREIKQFGYNFFPSKAPSFTPLGDAPVGPDYIIGPGDSFTISLWGRIEATFPVGVDRNGEITLPKAGAIKVWALTFSELKETIHNELSKYYSGFRISITMDRLRTIRVFVVGEAENPGSYTLGSVSTVYSALISAGGPSRKGTMRKIQLIRRDDVVKTIDIYYFLLRGDKSHDERLQSGDTIFIPVIGPVVGIAGNVKRPAIYEIKESMNLEELMDLAGGVTFHGYLQRVQIERIEAHQRKVVADFDISESLEKEGRQLKTPLRDGDLVKVFPILSTTGSIVYLEGHVKRPGGYEFEEGMKLLDLIPSFDQLLPEPYLGYAEIIRLVPPDLHPQTISFNLEKLLLGDPLENIELKEYDRITISPREHLQVFPFVSIGGEVKRPGRYLLLDNMRVKDLIYKAGNLKRGAYLQKAEMTRLRKTEKEIVSKVININLSEAMRDNPEHNVPLVEDDYILIRQIPGWFTEKNVILEGEVKLSGMYSISKGERLSSVLERAGGFTEDAYLKGAFFTRESAKRVQEERIKAFGDRMEADILREEARVAEGALSEKEIASLEQSVQAKKAILMKLKTSSVTGRVVIHLDSLDKFKVSKYDMELEEGDTLTIPSMPGIVNVLGSVYNPVSIVYTRGNTVNFYLNKVGGPTPDAEEDEIYIIRADGSVVSRSQKSTLGLSWDSEGKRWLSGGFMSARIDPGDTILVPTKITRFVWKKEIMDWTQIFFQIAVSAGVIIAAY